MTQKFQIGELVQRRNQPESSGVVREAGWDDQTETWTYRVQFGRQVVAVPESSLETLPDVATSWSKFTLRQFSGIEHFRDTLTFHKLRSPTARVAYAYSTARTLFYPHQFKPLLKFLDGGGRGILIADDVGLGKTIEAGYILRELQARGSVDRVLIVAPARLGPKWKREMKQRFGEEFEIVKRVTLLDLARRTEAAQETPPFKYIASYESIRPEGVREVLEASQIAVNVLIVDEAHRLRNPDTLQHKIGRVLCDSADTAVFLTATPVQTSLQDLWNLLRLISPDEFPDWTIFQGQIRTNGHILEAQRALGSSPPDIDTAIGLLSRLAISHQYETAVSPEIVSDIVRRLGSQNATRDEIAELSNDISQLNTLGHMVSRTRKVEAMPDCALRRAMWTEIDLTPAERLIYDSVEELCRVGDNEDSWGMRMAAMMAYRATASCIPAAIGYFRQRLETRRELVETAVEDIFEAGELLDDSVREETRNRFSNWFDSKHDRLTALVENWNADGGVDTKLENLIGALEDIWSEDDEARRDRRKIVLFSFFRKTLEYLNTTLRARRLNVEMIHGGVSIDDREAAIDRFLTDPRIPVLLTSEVGGEGIDLQKASVVINYDLPWNPMVVEQRIGRVDRIGQESKVILVLNFVIGDSIEKTILERLLMRIGVFEFSIGEIDPIIGDEIESLTREALSGTLTPAELERRIAEKELAIENRRRQAAEVEDDVNNLMTADQTLLSEIEAITAERQIPTENDLLAFVNRYLAREYPGYQLDSRAASEVINAKLSPALGQAMEDADRLGPDVAHFGRRLSGPAIPLTVSREVAYRHPHVELVHVNHPLVKFVVGGLEGRFGEESFAIGLPDSNVLPAGDYIFGLRLVKFKRQTFQNRLVGIFKSITTDALFSEHRQIYRVLAEIIDAGDSLGGDHFSEINLKTEADSLERKLDELKNILDRRERDTAIGRRERRKAIALRLAQMKVNRAAERLSAFRENQAREFAIQMAESKLAKAQEELRTVDEQRIDVDDVGVAEWADVAVGLLRVFK